MNDDTSLSYDDYYEIFTESETEVSEGSISDPSDPIVDRLDSLLGASSDGAKASSPYDEYYVTMGSTRLTNYLLMAVIAVLILIFVFRRKNK